MERTGNDHTRWPPIQQSDRGNTHTFHSHLEELIDHLAMLKINRLHFTQEVHDTTPEGQQKMKDMNLYAKSKKITISNGTTHTHDIISYLPFQAELLIWKANISDCDEDKKGYSNI